MAKDTHILVVAYGNPLRGDDGLAWRAADLLEQGELTPRIEVVRLHQLTPEVAETVRSRDAVIFVDATLLGTQNSRIPDAKVAVIHRGDVTSAPNKSLGHGGSTRK